MHFYLYAVQSILYSTFQIDALFSLCSSRYSLQYFPDRCTFIFMQFKVFFIVLSRQMHFYLYAVQGILYSTFQIDALLSLRSSRYSLQYFPDRCTFIFMQFKVFFIVLSRQMHFYLYAVQGILYSTFQIDALFSLCSSRYSLQYFPDRCTFIFMQFKVFFIVLSGQMHFYLYAVQSILYSTFQIDALLSLRSSRYSLQYFPDRCTFIFMQFKVFFIVLSRQMHFYLYAVQGILYSTFQIDALLSLCSSRYSLQYFPDRCTFFFMQFKVFFIVLSRQMHFYLYAVQSILYSTFQIDALLSLCSSRYSLQYFPDRCTFIFMQFKVFFIVLSRQMHFFLYAVQRILYSTFQIDALLSLCSSRYSLQYFPDRCTFIFMQFKVFFIVLSRQMHFYLYAVQGILYSTFQIDALLSLCSSRYSLQYFPDRCTFIFMQFKVFFIVLSRQMHFFLYAVQRILYSTFQIDALLSLCSSRYSLQYFPDRCTFIFMQFKVFFIVLSRQMHFYLYAVQGILYSTFQIDALLSLCSSTYSLQYFPDRCTFIFMQFKVFFIVLSRQMHFFLYAVQRILYSTFQIDALLSLCSSKYSLQYFPDRCTFIFMQFKVFFIVLSRQMHFYLYAVQGILYSTFQIDALLSLCSSRYSLQYFPDRCTFIFMQFKVFFIVLSRQMHFYLYAVQGILYSTFQIDALLFFMQFKVFFIVLSRQMHFYLYAVQGILYSTFQIDALLSLCSSRYSLQYFPDRCTFIFMQFKVFFIVLSRQMHFFLYAVQGILYSTFQIDALLSLCSSRYSLQYFPDRCTFIFMQFKVFFIVLSRQMHFYLYAVQGILYSTFQIDALFSLCSSTYSLQYFPDRCTFIFMQFKVFFIVLSRQMHFYLYAVQGILYSTFQIDALLSLCSSRYSLQYFPDRCTFILYAVQRILYSTFQIDALLSLCSSRYSLQYFPDRCTFIFMQFKVFFIVLSRQMHFYLYAVQGILYSTFQIDALFSLCSSTYSLQYFPDRCTFIFMQFKVFFIVLSRQMHFYLYAVQGILYSTFQIDALLSLCSSRYSLQYFPDRCTFFFMQFNVFFIVLSRQMHFYLYAVQGILYSTFQIDALLSLCSSRYSLQYFPDRCTFFFMQFKVFFIVLSRQMHFYLYAVQSILYSTFQIDALLSLCSSRYSLQYFPDRCTFIFMQFKVFFIVLSRQMHFYLYAVQGILYSTFQIDALLSLCSSRYSLQYFPDRCTFIFMQFKVFFIVLSRQMHFYLYAVQGILYSTFQIDALLSLCSSRYSLQYFPDRCTFFFMQFKVFFIVLSRQMHFYLYAVQGILYSTFQIDALLSLCSSKYSLQYFPDRCTFIFMQFKVFFIVLSRQMHFYLYAVQGILYSTFQIDALLSLYSSKYSLQYFPDRCTFIFMQFKVFFIVLSRQMHFYLYAVQGILYSTFQIDALLSLCSSKYSLQYFPDRCTFIFMQFKVFFIVLSRQMHFFLYAVQGILYSTFQIDALLSLCSSRYS